MRFFALGICTSSISSMVRLRASLLSIFMWSSSASEIWRLMVSTGFRLVIGSWKIMAMLWPRIARTSSSSIFRTSWPSNMIEPLTILPGGWGIRRISESAVTDFPQPDSPTMPRVSPAPTSNVTPSTARTTPSRVKNCVCRSLTSSNDMRAAHPFPKVRQSLVSNLDLHPRVEGVPQPVSEEREGQHHDADAEGRQQDRPGRSREDHEPFVDHDAPGRCRRLDADTEERQRRLGEHRARDAEGHRDDDRGEQVREQVADHDPARRRADRARGLDELALLERQDLTPYEPGHADPVDDGDGHEDEQQPTLDVSQRGVPQRGHDDEEEEQVRERVDDVGDAHEDLVDPAAVVPGREADGHADEEDDRDGHEADEHRDLRRPQEAREDVAAELVAAERIGREREPGPRPDRLHERVRRVLLQRILEPAELRHERHRHRQDHEEDDDDHPDHRGTIAEESVPRVLPERALLADEDVEVGGALGGGLLAGGRGNGRHLFGDLDARVEHPID